MKTKQKAFKTPETDSRFGYWENGWCTLLLRGCNPGTGDELVKVIRERDYQRLLKAARKK